MMSLGVDITSYLKPNNGNSFSDLGAEGVQLDYMGMSESSHILILASDTVLVLFPTSDSFGDEFHGNDVACNGVLCH